MSESLLRRIELFVKNKQNNTVHFVSAVYILPLNPLPEVVFWGTRVFVYGESVDPAIPCYFEGLMVPAWDSPQGPTGQYKAGSGS